MTTPSPAEFDKAFQLLADHCDPAEANTPTNHSKPRSSTSSPPSPNGKALKVVTDAATASAEEVGQWYRQRTLVEVDILWAKMFGDAEAWRAAYEQALGYAAKTCLPKRPPGRQYKREAYPRRPKADQFKKQHPQPLAEDALE
jgi:hypothetical protein